MDTQTLRRLLCKIGKDLFWMGLESPRSGNLSAMLQDGRSFLITRRGSSMRALDATRDLVRCTLEQPHPELASSEVDVHHAIYLATSHKAIVHAHPPYAVALSFTTDRIRPVHNEGRAVLGDIVVTTSNAIEGQGEDPAPIVEALKHSTTMIVRGHGAFCAAEDLETAFYHMGLLEASCKIIHLAHGAGAR